VVKQAPRTGIDHALGRRHGVKGINNLSEAQRTAVRCLLTTAMLPPLSHGQRAVLRFEGRRGCAGRPGYSRNSWRQ